MKKKLMIGTVTLLMVFIVGSLTFYSMGQNINEPSAVATIDVNRIFEAYQDHEIMHSINEEFEEAFQELQEQAEQFPEEQQQMFIQEQYQVMQAEFEARLIDEILSDIEPIIDEIAKEQGFDMVVDEGVVIYGQNDITEKFFQRFMDN